MDVRGTPIRLVQRADAHEAHRSAGLGIVAPDGNLAGRTACDLLAAAAGRGRVGNFGLTSDLGDAVRLVERVEGVRRPRLPLAPATMTGMHDQRHAMQTIAQSPTGAAAFHRASPNKSVCKFASIDVRCLPGNRGRRCTGRGGPTKTVARRRPQLGAWVVARLPPPWR